jgi:peptidyl-prolyl cis-trans isomerase C
MTKTICLLKYLPLLLLLAGCSTPKQDSEVVAQVDKETLTLAELKANFSATEWKNLTQEQKKEYAQQWVNLVLLAREAEQQGLADDKAIKNRVKYAGRKVLANALIASRLASEQVGEDELFNYYRIHQGEFSKPIQNYKVQRIFLTDASLLAKVRLELQNGMKFEDAAKVFSQEPLGQNGGYMGTVTPDGADSTIWHALQPLKLFEITTLQKDNGYYLLRYYMEEQGSGPSGFEGQKDIIRRRILDERRRQVYDELLQELKSQSDVYLMI